MYYLPDRIEKLFLALIVLWAAALRLGWWGINSFSFDEARVSQLALRMARLGDFAELGMQSSTGVPNFPAAVWLFTLPYAISTDPHLATAVVGLITTAGTGLVWWLARQAGGRWAGLGAAVLYATGPYMIFYARNIWSQNLLPPLALLWAATAVYGLSRPARPGRDLSLALHAFLSGFIAQVHLAGVVLVFGSVWLGVRYRLWHRWRPVLLGVAAGVGTAVPTLWTIRQSGAGAQAELADIAGGTAQTHWGVFGEMTRLGTGHGWDDLWLNAAWEWPPLLAASLTTAETILLLAAAVGLPITVYHAWTRRHTRTPAAILATLLPIWLLAAPLFFLRSKTPAYIQYQLPSAVAVFLLVGWTIGRLRPRRQPAAVAVCVLIGLTQTAAVSRTLAVSARQLIPGGMGTPLHYPHAAVQTLTTGQNAAPVVVHAIGNQPVYDGDAAVFHVLLWGHDHRLVDARHNAIVPGGAAHILATFETVPAWRQLHPNDIPPLAAGTIHPLPRRTNEPPYMALTTAGTPPDLADWHPIPADRPTTLATGARLTAWRTEPTADDRLRLLTAWRITDAHTPTDAQIQQFNHLYTAADPAQPTAVSDTPTSSGAWRSGDTLITWAVFDAPSEPILHFDVGMYTWPDLERTPVLGRGDGDPLAPIRLPVNDETP